MVLKVVLFEILPGGNRFWSRKNPKWPRPSWAWENIEICLSFIIYCILVLFHFIFIVKWLEKSIPGVIFCLEGSGNQKCCHAHFFPTQIHKSWITYFRFLNTMQELFFDLKSPKESFLMVIFGLQSSHNQVIMPHLLYLEPAIHQMFNIIFLVPE